MDRVFVATLRHRPITATQRNDNTAAMHCAGCGTDTIIDLDEHAGPGDVKRELIAYTQRHAPACRGTHVEVLDIAAIPVGSDGLFALTSSAG